MSLNPPFFALHIGERIAMVMTTSSGDWRSNASRPLRAPGVKCETTCLIRSTDMSAVLNEEYSKEWLEMWYQDEEGPHPAHKLGVLK